MMSEKNENLTEKIGTINENIMSNLYSRDICISNVTDGEATRSAYAHATIRKNPMFVSVILQGNPYVLQFSHEYWNSLLESTLNVDIFNYHDNTDKEK